MSGSAGIRPWWPVAGCQPIHRGAALNGRVHARGDMPLTGVRLTVATADDARGRLLSELAAGPARKGYAIAYDLLGNRAEAEEAVQEALARACESIGDLRDPQAAPAWYLRIVTTVCLRNLRRRKLRRTVFGRFGWFGSDHRRDDDAPTEAAPDDVAGMV